MQTTADTQEAGLLRPAISLFIVLSVLLGLAYPAVVTGVAQLIFPEQAQGRLIERDGKIIGSEGIGQNFTRADDFWPRPSLSGNRPYDPQASSGSNWAPSHPALRKAVEERVAALRAADPAQTAAIPVDLVTASGSGLDPHISLAAALYQAPRIARTRQLSKERVAELIRQHTRHPTGFIGETHVNVLTLNLALEQASRQAIAPDRPARDDRPGKAPALAP